MDKLKMHSPDLTQQNIDKLLELFPNCKTEKLDDKGNLSIAVDFDLLKQELSKNIVEGPKERYQLNWPGKKEALLTANAPIAKTLRPCREESVDFDTTENLFIEGDNLDALKLLQETYLGKVKMIYIDPPYNTGNDFIYNDDFSESSEEYFLGTEQKDEEGNRLVANKDSNGRFHSDWLSMMYSRLRLAKDFLTDDGLVFISIDDNESANLAKICDEIYGGENFVGSISWLKKRKGSFLSKKLVSMTELLLVYSKTNNIKLFGGKADDSESQPLIKRTNAVGVLTFPSLFVRTKLADGIYSPGYYGDGTSAVELLESITVKRGVIENSFSLKGPFIWGQNYLDSQIKNGARLIINTEKFQVRAFKAPDPDSHKGLSSFINGVEIGATNEDGYEQLRDILQAEGVMSYPKPVNYIKYLVNAATNWNKDALIVDFFAGSSSTAHAVMELNKEDGGKRRFIMVQLPELCDEKSEAFKAGYKTIAEISKERIRRAGTKIKEENPEATNLDTGFRVLKIDSSNMNEVHYTPDAVSKGDLFNQVEHIKTDRTAEDLLFQVMLDWGVDLSLPIRKETIEGKEVYFVNDDDQAPCDLVACFEKGIDEPLIKALAAKEPLRVVFRDDGFASDSLKINVEQIFKQLAPATDIKVI